MPVEYDGSEDVEALTGLDRALLDYREAVDSIIAADKPNPAARNKQPKEGRSATPQEDVRNKEESGDKLRDSGGAVAVKFHGYYANARVIGYEMLADKIRDIADDGSNDMLANGKIDHENINRSRLRVDVYRWLLSKALPKVYSDQGVKIAVGDSAERAPDVVLTGNDVDI